MMHEDEHGVLCKNVILSSQCIIYLLLASWYIVSEMIKQEI
jgi:hypothetical protein